MLSNGKNGGIKRYMQLIHFLGYTPDFVFKALLSMFRRTIEELTIVIRVTWGNSKIKDEKLLIFRPSDYLGK